MSKETLDNFAAGILGKILLIVGFFVLLKYLIFGLIIMLFGGYLSYQSKTYVHTDRGEI